METQLLVMVIGGALALLNGILLFMIKSYSGQISNIAANINSINVEMAKTHAHSTRLDKLEQMIKSLAESVVSQNQNIVNTKEALTNIADERLRSIEQVQQDVRTLYEKYNELSSAQQALIRS